MTSFTSLWNSHPGKGYVCDSTTFANQCAMRMGTALRACGADLSGLSTCVGYSRTFASHAPGHVRGAQDIANRFHGKTTAHGLGATAFRAMTGSIDANMAYLKDRNGMIFIMNGWGSTDHIDVWRGNGRSGVLKGGDPSYYSLGSQIWFWEFA
ncbi:MAG: T6SS effector amidase Tae4 family protein [Sphingomonas sp.]